MCWAGRLQGRLPEILAFAGAGKSAFGKMNDHQFAHAGLQQRTGGVPQ
jgi:hypothetical protein